MNEFVRQESFKLKFTSSSSYRVRLATVITDTCLCWESPWSLSAAFKIWQLIRFQAKERLYSCFMVAKDFKNNKKWLFDVFDTGILGDIT